MTALYIYLTLNLMSWLAVGGMALYLQSVDKDGSRGYKESGDRALELINRPSVVLQMFVVGFPISILAVVAVVFQNIKGK